MSWWPAIMPAVIYRRKNVTHWRVFDRHVWDGNSMATEPVEHYVPACDIDSEDYVSLVDNMDDVTCDDCRAVIRTVTEGIEPGA